VNGRASTPPGGGALNEVELHGRTWGASGVKHTIYEDRITHKFAIIRLPEKFAEGDKLPIPPTTRWFSTREETVAALPDLLDQDEAQDD
jgi:hypothetical protein